MQQIHKNIERLQKELAPYPDARLMAVIKTRTAEEIDYAIRCCGIDLVGENRVQELIAHYEVIAGKAELHMIGTLQKNKVKYIIDKVDMIESLDSESLAAEIDRQAKKHDKKMPVLIEVNIGREAAKSGVLPEALPAFCESLHAYSSLVPMGLMTIAPRCENAEEYNCYFSEMRSMSESVFSKSFPNVKRPILSMGMSGSYRQALENGTNIVRIGEGIFGKRTPFTKT